MKVVNRAGELVDFNPEKLNKWAEWASDTCGISWNDIVLSTSRSFYDGMQTKDIHNSLIETCVNRRTTAHSRMASRLLVGQIYKEAFGDFSIPSLYDFYSEMVADGYWMDMGYSEEDLNFLDKHIDHTLDFTYEYCTVRQFYDKYATTAYGRCIESPQMALIGVALSNVKDEDGDRVKSALDCYKELSILKINLPTPSLAGQRTQQSGSPSCCVITGDDSVDSIEAAVHVAYKMTAMSSGIGAELNTRSPKDPVKNGTIEHLGKMGYYRYLDRAVKANRQHSRGGSATVTFSALDPEIESLLRLKSQRVHPDSRIDTMDYSLGITNLLLKKAAKGEDWMLVSRYYAPELYELQYAKDAAEFEKEYERVFESGVKKQIVKAREVIDLFFGQRSDVGRIYKTNYTNLNSHTPFKQPVRLSNLCQEVCLVTDGFENVQSLYDKDAEKGEIALCFLASTVAGRIPLNADGNINIGEYYKTIYQVCKFVDNTIEQSTYPFPAVERSAKARRSIGIGLTDVAHYMAKNGWMYDSEEGRNALHRLAEAHSYCLHKASVQLAKERGKCEWIHKTGYADESPWLPIDTYAKEVDKHHSQELLCDWEGLRKEIKEFGVRFSVHEAYMPVESSSVFTASTNGLYPIRDKRLFKKSQKGTVYFEAPGLEQFGENYQNAYDISTKDMIKVYAIFQKFCGQSISADFYQKVFGEHKVSMKDQYESLFFAAKMGMKTWYYLNSKTNETVEAVAEQEQKEESCDSCTL